MYDVVFMSSDFIVLRCLWVFSFFFFKQKTAYEMRISDWSSDGALPISVPDLSPRRREGGCHRYTVIPMQEPMKDLSYPRRRVSISPCEDSAHSGKIGRASCRERVCQYV